MSSTRVFVIGFDALDKDIIEKWAAEGVLPHFKKLLDNSIYGDIDVPRGLEAGCVWPTFYFGLRPGNMGQYDGARLFDPSRYDHYSYQPSKDSTPPIWTTLSQAGKLCAVIDAPYNYPVDNINGIKIVDRAGHVPAGGGDFLRLRTHPPELAEEIVSMFGPDPAGGRSSDYFAMDTVEQIDEFRRIYTSRIANKTDMILHYWDKKPWDFFMSVFTEAHCAGHRCWHLHDPQHHQHNADLAKAAGNPLKDIYIALDQAVGRLIEAVKDDARIIVFLSHGMGPRHTGTRVLDRILARLDNQRVATRSNPLLNLARRIWRHLPEQLRKPFLKVRNNLTNDGFQPNRHQRRFFEVYANDRTAGIRINLAGREANGIVEAAQFDALCDQLTADLLALKNQESSEPAVREVIRVKDMYAGPFRDHLPDLLVTWNRSHPINFIGSDKTGIVDTVGIDMTTRTGDHRIKGRFFAIANDWLPHKLESNVKTEDFAPTIAALTAVTLEKTDGKIIADLVSVPSNPPQGMADNPSEEAVDTA